MSRGFSGYSSDVQEFLSRWLELICEGDPFYNPNLSLFDARCLLREPGEDEEWLAMITGLIQTVPPDVEAVPTDQGHPVDEGSLAAS